MGTDAAIETEMKDKGLNAPRVTPADVENEIEREFTFNAGTAVDTSGHTTLPVSEAHKQTLGLLTICVLVLRNGFTVTGESACASPENFDAEIGRKVARSKAVEKIWPLLGFRLRDKLAAS